MVDIDNTDDIHAALAQLTADVPAPRIDMDDIRLDPNSQEIDDGDNTLLARRVDGEHVTWIARDGNGVQREIDEIYGRYALPRWRDKPVMRVFLSSTFRDMAVERTHLIRTVFPRLKQLALRHGITLQEIDLRWGVTKEQVERGETVAICLDEIDRCRDYPPFFIGMLGERYGWIPEGEALDALDLHAEQRGTNDANADIRQRARELGLSVTEMEIRYGVLDQPPARRHAFFYTRAPELTALLSRRAGNPRDYVDPEHVPMQTRLKDELRASGLVRIDGYRSAAELGEDIERMLGAAILRLARSVNAVSTQYREPMPYSLAANQAIDRQLEAERIDLRRNTRLSSTDSYHWSCGADLSVRLLLVGPPGSGKRALANIECLALQPVTLHCRNGFFNNTLGAIRYLRTVLRGHELIAPWDGLPGLGFREALESIGGRVVICITDVDALADGRDLVALLSLVANRNLKIILTASDPSYAQAAPSFTAIEVGPLDGEDRHAFIGTYLQSFRKKLGPAEADRVAALPLADSPAFLRLLLDELRRGATFETLPILIDAYAGMTTLEDAYELALDTWHHYVAPQDSFGAQWKLALDTLCVATYGVPEGYFTSEHGAGLPPLAWATWLGLAEPVLLMTERGWLLGNRQVRTAIERRGAADQPAARRRFAAFLLAAETRHFPIEASEITLQLMACAEDGSAEDVARLQDWLLETGTVRVLGAYDVELMVQAWRALLAHGGSAALLGERDLPPGASGALVPLLIELRDWPTMEAVMRRALVMAPGDLAPTFASQLAIALWHQRRIDEAVDVIAPSLRAWMQARDGMPPETMAPLLTLIVDDEIASAPWEDVLLAGFEALAQPRSGPPTAAYLALMFATMPFLAKLGQPLLTLAIAHQAILASYELTGTAGEQLRLLSVAEGAHAFNALGKLEETIDLVRQFLDIGKRDGREDATHGRCARALGSALFDLGRWDEARLALDYAWEFEVTQEQDPAVAVLLSAMQAICLVQLRQVDRSREWLGRFTDCAPHAPALAWQTYTWIASSLHDTGRDDECIRLEQSLPPKTTG